MKRHSLSALLLGLVMAFPVAAADYKLDDTHSFVQFRIQHLGFSWLYGRFNTLEGGFSYDEAKPEAAEIKVTIDAASIDTNHAERDKHLRGKDFFYVDEYPKATFVSTGYKPMGKDKGVLEGKLTLRGVTKPVSIEVTHVGAGDDPWGGYRRGFYGTTTITLADFGIPYDLGPAARSAELMLTVEGVRQ
jgi:polyisoprenoid-binding protein YceI